MSHCRRKCSRQLSRQSFIESYGEMSKSFESLQLSPTFIKPTAPKFLLLANATRAMRSVSLKRKNISCPHKQLRREATITSSSPTSPTSPKLGSLELDKANLRNELTVQIEKLRQEQKVLEDKMQTMNKRREASKKKSSSNTSLHSIDYGYSSEEDHLSASVNSTFEKADDINYISDDIMAEIKDFEDFIKSHRS